MNNASQSTSLSGGPEVGDRVGDYIIEEHLARGGMASVFGVRHEARGEKLALKLLHHLSSTDDSQNRFRREFRALSRLHHPNVLRVFEWGILNGRPWFTMEWLEGHDLREEVEGLQSGSLQARFARAEDVLVQVARALAYVHDHGLVHRDITPGNIFVEAEGRVKLMDFGVVKEVGADLTGVGEVIGTVAYMAPEQITGIGIDARADLYSLGAVLYLMLTGRRVFSAHTIHGFMEKHLNSRPRPPSELVPDVPQHLEEICLRLLEKEARNRYASASHLLHVLGDLEHGVSVEGQFPGRTVGRTLLKAQLSDTIEQVANGRKGRAMLLTGPSGQGKTRMLDLAEHLARRLGLPVATGRCRHHDRPFGAFVSIYRSIRGSNPAGVLEDVFRGDDNGKVWERYPILSAFRDLVLARAPVVLAIDDIDRADPATVELLSYLIRNTLELASEPVVFLLGHDGSDTRIRGQLESLAPVDVYELQPLDSSEVEELVVSLLGSSIASLKLAQRLHEEGGGSPALIADMLRGLLDDGRIVREETGGYRFTVDVSEITSSKLPMPDSLRQALIERLAPLPESALMVGRVLAHARRRVDLDVLVDAAPFEEDAVMEALDVLVDADIVREHRAEGGERVELSHGRFREVLIEPVPPKQRRDLHQALGEALERHYRGQVEQVVEELAYHFEHAKLAPKAYRYLVRTAQRHLKRSLNHEALAFLDRALHLEPQARPYMLLDDADRRLAEVYLAIARSRHGLGEIPEAVQATQRAQELARDVRDPGLQSRVATELASQLRVQGSAESAEEQARVAILRAEEAGDQHLLPTPLYVLGVIAWSKGNLEEAETLWRRSLQIAQQIGDERAQGRGYNGLAILAICRGESMDARRWFEQSATLFERLGMLGPLVVARVNLVELYTNIGLLRKALTLSERTVSQAKEVHNPQGMGLGKAWRARVLLLLGRYDEAARETDDALATVPSLPNREDHATVWTSAVLTQIEQERWEASLGPIRELLDVLEIHDHEGIQPLIVALQTLALASLGRREEAEAAFEARIDTHKPWPHVQIRTDLATGHALEALGRTSAACKAFKQALAASEANGYRYLQLLAHRELAVLAEGDASRDRHARVASGLARSLAANLPGDDADRFLRTHDDRGSRR